MKTTQLIGRDADKGRVCITIDMKDDGRLSITGTVYGYRSSHAWSCGQINMHNGLADITPAEGWTRADIESLNSIWDAWHLNDMRPYCEHMDLTGLGKTYDERKHITCDECGRFGEKWWRAEVPADVRAEIDRLQALPVGKLPAHSW